MTDDTLSFQIYLVCQQRRLCPAFLQGYVLDRSGSVNWQPSSRVNFLFCVFSCLFRAAVFHLYMPTKMGFHQNTPQHPKFWNMEIKKKQKKSLSLPTLLSQKDTKNHYIPQAEIYSVLMTHFPHSPTYRSSHLNASLHIHWWSPIAPKPLRVHGRFCGGLYITWHFDIHCFGNWIYWRDSSWVFYAPNKYIDTYTYVPQYKNRRKVSCWFHLNGAGFAL